MAKKINIGIEQKDLNKSVKCLTQHLADVFVLYLKTHNFHWNVVDPQFYSLHKMFDDQYEQLWESIDEIAERIRSLGSLVDGTASNLIKMSDISEASSAQNGDAMIKLLLNDHETIARSVRNFLTQDLDKATEDFLIERMEYHEKTAWMLRSAV